MTTNEHKLYTTMNSNEQPTPQKTGDSTSNQRPKRPGYNPLPPDHWIYKRGAQIGFVRGLPPSIKSSQTKDTETPSPSTEANSLPTSALVEQPSKPDSPNPPRNSPEAIKERLGAAYFLQILLEEEGVDPIGGFKNPPPNSLKPEGESDKITPAKETFPIE